MQKEEKSDTCFGCGLLYLEEEAVTERLLTLCGRDGHATGNWDRCPYWTPIDTKTMQLKMF